MRSQSWKRDPSVVAGSGITASATQNDNTVSKGAVHVSRLVRVGCCHTVWWFAGGRNQNRQGTPASRCRNSEHRLPATAAVTCAAEQQEEDPFGLGERGGSHPAEYIVVLSLSPTPNRWHRHSLVSLADWQITTHSLAGSSNQRLGMTQTTEAAATGGVGMPAVHPTHPTHPGASLAPPPPFHNFLWRLTSSHNLYPQGC